ncbi:unnamed protein product [Heterobilharzia americana]|nr:unnamed protein product [Heterobilharzia americana]CAH8580255.1 unnamed protein product [Heterobilharzia americana]
MKVKWCTISSFMSTYLIVPTIIVLLLCGSMEKYSETIITSSYGIHELNNSVECISKLLSVSIVNNRFLMTNKKGNQ